MQQGVIQNFTPYLDVTTLEGAKQTIAMGPVASQEAIKQLGTNGGGFFNANAAHPFENPTPWTNFWSMFAIFVDPVRRSPTCFGRMVKKQAHGWAVWAAMFVLFFAGVDHRLLGRGAGQPDPRGARHRRRRLGDAIPAATWRARRSASASRTPPCTPRSRPTPRAARSTHARLVHAARRLVPLVNMQLGEVIFGGVGAGLYGMLVMVVLTVFIAGLMVGRTPEYLGKKIQSARGPDGDALRAGLPGRRSSC